MALSFEWNARKARSNERKHGVSFEEAKTAFDDGRSIEIPDPLHSEREERFVLLGRSARGRLLVVVHTERGAKIRLIGARLATRRERKTYEEGEIQDEEG